VLHICYETESLISSGILIKAGAPRDNCNDLAPVILALSNLVSEGGPTRTDFINHFNIWRLYSNLKLLKLVQIKSYRALGFIPLAIPLKSLQPVGWYILIQTIR
jgi:hypothetical protein